MTQQVSNYDIFAEVEAELNSARSKFPEGKHMMTALTEEVGELAQALLDHDQGEQTNEQVFKEAIQVAAMAVRIASEGDSNFPYHPESGYRGPDWEGYKK